MVLLAGYTPLLFVAVLLWLWGVGEGGPESCQGRLAAGRALVATALALALGQVIAWVSPSPRPFTNHAVRLLVLHSPGSSFPSDHALAAFAIAGAVIRTHRGIGLGLFVLGALMGFARVFVGIHYPLDIVGGAIAGGILGGFIHRADAWVAPLVRIAGQWTDAVWRLNHWAGRRREGRRDRKGSRP